MIRTFVDIFRSQRRETPVARTGKSAFRRALSLTWSRARVLLLNRYFGFVVLALASSEILSRVSGISPLRSHLRIELPALLAVYWILNFALRQRRASAFVAALPVLVFYVGHDVFYLSWGNVFKAIDAQHLPELLKVLPLAREVAVVVGLGLPILLLLCYCNYKKYWRVLMTCALGALLVTTLELWPRFVLTSLGQIGLQVAEWSEAEMVNENGRFTTMLYFEARRRQASAETAMYRQRGDYDLEVRANVEFIRRAGNHRNIHLVVLESFVDPTLFNAVSFSQDPRHPEFAELVGDRQSFSISPVFGGETAQAEFEALCGVPALQRLSEIEFDDFTGAAAGCMPDKLRQAGYLTIVSNAFEPNYFNSTKAYTGVGFEKIYFPREYGDANSTYLTIQNASESETYLFDGDLFDENLGFIARTLKENPGRPILNYVLGIYGHEPHDIDVDRRPMVLSVTAAEKDDQLLRAANQYWYRTQAIARYIRTLSKLDPHALIIVVSDHLPPLGKGVKSYTSFRYLNNIGDNTHLNRIIVVENGTVVHHETIHHYEIPQLIYGYLTGNKFCAEHTCAVAEEELETKYMSLMARAVGSR